MVILRMFGDLPPDLEVELYRQTSGETVKWAGRSSGVVERAQGWAMVAAGAVLALVNLSGPAAALGIAVDFAERARTPEIPYFLSVLGGVMFFAGGVAIAMFGWRFVQSANSVVWAVTNRRLLRIVADVEQATDSWTRSEILKVERLHWDDREKRGLAITIDGRGDNNPTLIILGPIDLEACERALAEMES